jgi:hypothetical protein
VGSDQGRHGAVDASCLVLRGLPFGAP